MKNLLTLFVITGLYTIISCVPPQKFKEVNAKGNKLESERDQLMKENEQLTVMNTEMKSKMDMVEAGRQRFIGDSIKQSQELGKLNKDYSLLYRKYNDLESTHNALLQGNARETRRLLNELQTAQEDLQKKEFRLKELETTVSGERKDLTRIRAELEARNIKLAEMEKIL